LLGELQQLLGARAAELAGQWRFTLLAASGIGVIGLVVIGLLFLGRRTGVRAEAASESSGAHARPDRLPVRSLSSARDVLDGPELVRSGRSAQRRTWGDGDAR
jgi:hypothetical protein